VACGHLTCWCARYFVLIQSQGTLWCFGQADGFDLSGTEAAHISARTTPGCMELRYINDGSTGDNDVGLMKLPKTPSLLLSYSSRLMSIKQTMKPLQRLICTKAASPFAAPAVRRYITTSQRPLHPAAAQIKPLLSRSVFRKESKRSYADIATPKTKRRGRKLLRWTWRFTYLGAIGGILYMGYGIYQLRTPQEQLESGNDPTKKTLVILGTDPPSKIR
jgi:hypothetical protein